MTDSKTNRGQTSDSTAKEEDQGNHAVLWFQEETIIWDALQEMRHKQQTDDSLQQIQAILDRYLECPTLLDHALEKMVKLCVTCTLLEHNNNNNEGPFLRVLYSLCKVRGYKTVSTFLDPSVDTVSCVWERLKGSQEYHWQATYSLWVWMAILGRVPFDACKLCNGGLLSNLTQLATRHLTDHGPIGEAAAICLSRWLSRRDATQSLQAFLQDTVRLLQDDNSSSANGLFAVLGRFRTVNGVLKHSTLDREEILSYFQPLWTVIRNNNTTIPTNNTLVQKQFLKFLTRHSVLELVPSGGQWKYRAGRRRAVLGGSTSNQEGSMSTMERNSKSGNELWDVPDSVEWSTGALLEHVSHSSTIIRWSAAKGLGRIADKLPKLCGYDIVDALLENVNESSTSDTHWHGTCLALAELARRGLLLPDQLKSVVPRLPTAIHFDKRRGTTSVGAHVRDAACYTYWAFTRTYESEILRPFLSELSEAVILTALFDREVNCRRAASAAFQEAVGRQGASSVPHGIEILTAADYFALGNRENAYLNVSRTVAQFEQYRIPIIRHLSTCKLYYWDPTIRSLSSKALSNLVELEPAYFLNTVLPLLLRKCFDDRDLCTRHGALLGVAEVITAVTAQSDASLSEELVASFITLVPGIEKKRLYRGRGGEMMRSAVCRFIQRLSLSDIPLSVKEQVRLLDSLDGNLPHPNEDIQNCACTALEALMTNRFPVGVNGPSERLQNRVVNTFVKKIQSSDNPAVTRGYSLALGYLPAKLVAPSNFVLSSVVSCLSNTACPAAVVGGEGDAETRRNALVALAMITGKIGFASKRIADYPVSPLSSNLFSDIVQTFLLSLRDYKTDRRGDVGSWCRIEAMNGVSDLVAVVVETEQSHLVLNATIVTSIVAALFKQLAEKLDTVRLTASICLERILMLDGASILNISHHRALINCLQLPVSESLRREWYSASRVFLRVMEVASFGENLYFEKIIAGVVSSIGGLTEDISKFASSALISWTREQPLALKERLGVFLLQLMDGADDGPIRFLLPSIKTLDLLWTHGCFDDIENFNGSSFALNAVERYQAEQRSDRITVLLAIVDATTTILMATSVEAVARSARGFLCKLLLHRYPRVRGYTAQQLYTVLLNDDTEKALVAQNVLINTAWTTSSIEALGETQKELSGHLGILASSN